MDRNDVLEFATRDWARVAHAKTDAWVRRKQSSTPADLLAIVDQLHHHARAIRPDWPSAAERADDLAVHVRVGEALRATGRRLL